MNTYTMTCTNGWTDVIEAATLRAAKAKATRLASYDGGSFSIETPNGEIHSRRKWDGFNAWGFDAWEQVA